MFTFKKVGNLLPEDSIKAIKEPLKNFGYSFERALIDSILKKKLTLHDFDRFKNKLLTELDVSFFEDRFNKASDTEKKVLLSMARISEKEATMKTISDKSKIEYRTLVQILIRLMEKGLVHRPVRGKYSFSLPLF